MFERKLFLQMTAEEFQKEFICVQVHNPTIHEGRGREKYATYQIELKTNSLSFTQKYSNVQRTYSEFLWLRKALIKTTARSPPSLPFERILFGRFNQDYLKQNEAILTTFLQVIVKNTFFVSSAALHLFLQSDLSVKQMDEMIRQLNKNRGSMNALVRAKSIISPPHSPLDVTTPGNAMSSRSSDQDSVCSISSITPDENSTSSSNFSLERSEFCNKMTWDSVNNNNILNLNTELENSSKCSKVSYQVDSDYPKWLFAESFQKTKAKKCDDSNLLKVQTRLTKSYTEVSWNLHKDPEVLPDKHRSLTCSPVRFSIGEEILSHSKCSIGNSINQEQPITRFYTRFSKHSSSDSDDERQNLRKVFFCDNLQRQKCS